MLYILSAHFKNRGWIDIQLEYLSKYIKVPSKIWIATWGIERVEDERIDRVFKDVSEYHWEQLNKLASAVLDVADPEDYILFIDSDAFPIREINALEKILNGNNLAAIQRTENNGDPQPHPCFCLTRVDFWKNIEGDWGKGTKRWVGTDGIKRTDIGGLLYEKLNSLGIEWTKIHRSNNHSFHPLWFGIYGDLIYHHGSGSRPFFCASDFKNLPRWKFLLLKYGLARFDGAGMLDRILNFNIEETIKDNDDKTRNLSSLIIDDIKRDYSFWQKIENHIRASKL